MPSLLREPSALLQNLFTSPIGTHSLGFWVETLGKTIVAVNKLGPPVVPFDQLFGGGFPY